MDSSASHRKQLEGGCDTSSARTELQIALDSTRLQLGSGRSADGIGYGASSYVDERPWCMIGLSEEDTMEQPVAEQALLALQPLVGEWTVEAKGPDGQVWPGEGRAIFE